MATNKSKKTSGATKEEKVMHEYKEGTLHSGKGGPVVTNPKQAIAIALSEAGRSADKAKPERGERTKKNKEKKKSK